MPKSYEDSFIKVAGLIGGPDYIVIAKTLSSAENSTDEEIAILTDLKINVVSKFVTKRRFFRLVSKVNSSRSGEFLL